VRQDGAQGLARRALQALEGAASDRAVDELVLSTDASELGRFVVSRRYADLGAFRTPQLRNVGITAPYMHDGSLATLSDVVEFYRRGGGANAALDPRLGPLELTDPEAAALVAFLEALSSQAPRSVDPPGESAGDR